MGPHYLFIYDQSKMGHGEMKYKSLKLKSFKFLILVQRKYAICLLVEYPIKWSFFSFCVSYFRGNRYVHIKKTKKQHK